MKEITKTIVITFTLIISLLLGFICYAHFTEIYNFFSNFGMQQLLVCTIVLAVIAILLTVFVILQRFYRTTSAFTTIEISVLLMVCMSCLIMAFVMIQYRGFYSSTALKNVVEMRVVDMQATTLAITTLIVTFASIILTILSIYREKKTDQSTRLIEQQSDKIEKLNKGLSPVINVASMQLIAPEFQEFYYDLINDYIEEFKPDREIYVDNLLVVKIGIDGYMLLKEPLMNLTVGDFDHVIKNAYKVIESPTTSKLNRQFASLMALNIMYYKIQFKIRKNPFSASKDIEKAIQLLQHVSGEINDTYGNIMNLYGLVYLWSGIAKRRMKEKDEEVLRLLSLAQEYLKEALEKKPDNPKFINNYIVYLQQYYGIVHDGIIVNEIERWFITYQKIAPKEHRLYLNRATWKLRLLWNELCVPQLNDFPDLSGVRISKKGALKTIGEIEKDLQRSQELDVFFLNGYYKMVEAITLEIIIRKGMGLANIEKQKRRAQENMIKADEYSDIDLGKLYCFYGFYSVIGEKEAADAMRKRIEENKKKVHL